MGKPDEFDPRLEAYLHRGASTPPPAGMDARIIGAAPRRKTGWVLQVVAAAAVLVLAIGLGIVIQRARQSAVGTPLPSSVPSPSALPSASPSVKPTPYPTPAPDGRPARTRIGFFGRRTEDPSGTMSLRAAPVQGHGRPSFSTPTTLGLRHPHSQAQGHPTSRSRSIEQRTAARAGSKPARLGPPRDGRRQWILSTPPTVGST